jgi:hypothetical protein
MSDSPKPVVSPTVTETYKATDADLPELLFAPLPAHIAHHECSSRAPFEGAFEGESVLTIASALTDVSRSIAPVPAIIPRGPEKMPWESEWEYWERLKAEAKFNPECAVKVGALTTGVPGGPREGYWKGLAAETRLDPEYSALLDAPMKEWGVARPKRELEEPKWTGGFRGRVAKLLWDRGLKRKAIQFLNCNKCASPGVCNRYPLEHKFFVPNGCEVVFCRECADEFRRALTLNYTAVILAAIAGLGECLAMGAFILAVIAVLGGFSASASEFASGVSFIPKGWVLWRVTFTLRSDGSEITPTRVKAMNMCIGAVMRRAVGSRNGYGMVFVDEVGFEKRGHPPDAQRVAHGLNLHAHGLYFGPALDWYRVRDLWIEVTRKKFGVESRGFYYTVVRKFAANPERAVRWALNHMFKYVSKPPAVTPDRLASLIAAFDTARRVHSLGLFFGKKSKREKRDCPCPKCRAMGILSTVSFEGRMLPNGGSIPRRERIELLIAEGYVPLREAGREAVLAMGGSHGDSS